MNLLSFDEYEKNEQKIYSEIENYNWKKNGVKKDFKIEKGRSGIAIAFQYHKTFSKKLEKISNDISKIIDSISFKEDEFHTGLIIIRNQVNNINESEKISSLKKSLDSIKNLEILTPTIEKFLVSENGIILKIKSTENFHKTIKKAYYEYEYEKNDIVISWSSHITINRFKESKKLTNEEINKIEKILDTSNLNLDNSSISLNIIKYNYSENSKFGERVSKLI